MPIVFLDNYPKHNIEESITKQDGTPLQGEIWIYRQFLQFNEHNFLPSETWYLKHNYNLSTHPSSKGKVEGQIDFIVLSKFGLLVIEVKGGGLKVDENDCYYSYNKYGQYITQNPFIQAKEYVHSLKNLNEKSNVFVFRAVIFPHESGFELKGNQLIGYQDIFFSKRDYAELDSDFAINKVFFEFVSNLGKKTRKHNITELNPSWSNQKINSNLFVYYPELSSKDIRRLKSELFPIQSSFGYNPDRINSEIILNENYEILKGLRRNIKVMVQGGPGTGKTTLSQKFLAECLLKQQKGIYFCANKLIRSKLEHIIINEYELDPNYIEFFIYSEFFNIDVVYNDVDFAIFDEAQEYFDKGLFDFIELLDKDFDNPKILVLYDPDQSIISNYKELAWYTDFFIDAGYVHYYFDETFRCIQFKEISDICSLILKDQYNKLISDFTNYILVCKDLIEKLRLLKNIIDESRFDPKEKIILINSFIMEAFQVIASDYFRNNFEELTENNINVSSQKIRYTSPLKYRGLENKCVYLITDEINERNKAQNFVGATRAIEYLNIVLWK